MARGDILRKLFKSFSENDREEFQLAALQLIQEEKEKNHTLLANDLERILQLDTAKVIASSNNHWNHYPEVPKDKDTGLPLIEISLYNFNWDRVVLPQKTLEIFQRIVQEYRKKEVLNAYGLKSISKLLLCGPPGCGKTLSAKVLAGVLGLPLVYVNLPAVFSSYLGQTAVNLKKIFDYLKKGEWVILFDEFDALAKERNSSNEHGEIHRLVNSLLQLIENYQNSSILVAATNHESLIDVAIWRRFDEVIFLGLPNDHLRRSLLSKYLLSIEHKGLNLDQFASQLKGSSGADIERICHDAIKSVILKHENLLTENDLKDAFKRHKERIKITKQYLQTLDQSIVEEENDPI